MNMVDAVKALGDKITKPFDIISDQLEHWQGRKDAEQQHRHAMERAQSEQERTQIQQQFEQQQAQQQQEFDAKQEERRQRFQAELDDLVARKEIERAAQVAQSIANYQKTMADCAVSIGESLGKMRIELLAEATKLVNDQHRICDRIQKQAFNNANNIFKEIANLTERQQAVMERQVDRYLANAIDASDNFLKTVDSEFKRLNGDIIVITGKTMEKAQEYISLKTSGNLIDSKGTIALSEPK